MLQSCLLASCLLALVHLSGVWLTVTWCGRHLIYTMYVLCTPAYEVFRKDTVTHHNLVQHPLHSLPFSLSMCVQGRSNIILAGDSQGDPKMADSLPHTHHVLKIGFLNHDVSSSLATNLSFTHVI